MALIVTYTISIDADGNVYNDTQTYGNSYAQVYAAFIAIKAEVDRQIIERRNCPYNPKYGLANLGTILTASQRNGEGITKT